MPEPVIKIKRKVWHPTTSSPSLVITLPVVEFLKEGDEVEVTVMSDRSIIIKKSK